MMKASKLILLIPLFFLMACSAAYDQVKEMDIKNPNTFQQHLLNNYKINASFEAEKMHDWNSAKLYSEKALRALDGENIYPEEITYWKLPTKIAQDISSSYYNLLSIYDEAIIKNPKSLAKAISSLDCWAEQEEEKWQTWDIDKCKNDFHTAMHDIYNFLTEEDEKKEVTKVNEKEAEEEVRKGFHCLSDWNGSHSAVVKFTKEQLRDPKSFEHDKTLVWPVSSDGTHQLVMQYRAKNGFGGMTAGVVKAFYSNSDCKATIKSID